MTIDERIAFLVQSTESLHTNRSELTGRMQEQTRQMWEQTKQLQEHTRQLEIDADNIRRLANIAASHQQRLDDFEGRGQA